MHRFASPAWIRRAEWTVAIAATAILVGLHLEFLRNAGALWRDEVNSVNIASLPSLADVWAHLRYESFPILWLAALRGWIRLGPGATDFGIRILGLAIGLGVVGALWRNARALGHSIPLIGLALLGWNSAVIMYGDSVRGYGLGILTGLLTLGLVWEAAESPTAGRMALAFLAALVSVHCLYQSAVVVFAACVAGAAVALRRKSWRPAVILAGIGAACAISLVPYLPTIAAVRGQDAIRRVDPDSGWIWLNVRATLASTGATIHWVWIVLAGLALAAAAFAGRTGDAPSARERDAALYGAVTILAGIPAYVLFLRIVGYASQPWYTLVLLALVAASLDAPLRLLARDSAVRWARLAIVGAIAVLVLPSVRAAVGTRKTNLDVVATRMRQLTAKGDLIVVNPWYLGLTFNRYYGGQAGWVTVPPGISRSLHRYDLVKERMMSPGVMAPVLQEMRGALQRGRNVFWVGDLFLPASGEQTAEPPPPTRAPWGWSDAPYYYHWGLQAGQFIQAHARAAERLELPLRQAVDPHEDAALYVFSGWWGEE